MTDPHYTPEIPREFWSEYLERPFEACVQCESPLLSSDWTGYVIQKHVVAGETVFEMAMCVDCARRMKEELSEQSQQSINEFIRLAPERRRREADARSIPVADQTGRSQEDILADHSWRWRDRAMSNCAICAKLQSECHRYSFGTACLSAGVLTGLPGSEDLGSPFLICDECESKVNECISEQTRDAWDRFVEDNFDGPPELSVDPHELTLVF